MAKHLTKFTKPFENSRIPYLLAEVLTNGAGEMVDLVCRYINPPAAALANLSAPDLRGKRFTRLFPAQRLADLQPLSSVAFSGSSVSFPYTTVLGRHLTITCYQPMYGLAACILDAAADVGPAPVSPGAALPAAAVVLELSRAGTKCVSFNHPFCQLCNLTRRELLNRADDASLLAEPEDRPVLLQALLDAGRSGRPANQEFHLVRKGLPSIWVRLQAQPLPSQGDRLRFYAVLTDIDLQRQTQDQLRQAQGQLESLKQLFTSFPGGYCLFHIPDSSSAQLLGISQGLAELLDFSQEELTRRITADPLCQVFPGDREELLSAAAQAQSAGMPLHHFCRLETRQGALVWVSLRAIWKPQADGSQTMYVTCSDVTALREAQAALEVQSRLNSLLLERSQLISLDYDPASDSALVSYSRGGRPVSRTIQGYLTHLADSPSIHPEDRKRLITAVRRSVSRPTAQTLEYRGEYGTDTWRWYRVSWTSLFDEGGNVHRLLGKAEDISLRKAAQARQQALLHQQQQLARQALLCLRLDLSKDRILSVAGSQARTLPLSPGDTADSCLAHLQQCIPDPAEQIRFQNQFRRQALLEAYQSGILHTERKNALDLSGGTVDVLFSVELAENPDTLHLEAFFLAVQAADQTPEFPS